MKYFGLGLHEGKGQSRHREIAVGTEQMWAMNADANSQPVSSICFMVIV